MNKKIKSKIIRHLSGLLIFGSLLLIISFSYIDNSKITADYSEVISIFSESGLDINSSYDREIFSDAVTNFFSGDKKKSGNLIAKLNEFIEKKFTEKDIKTGSYKKRLSGGVISEILWKFLKFISLFAAVEFLIFYLAERLASVKFYLEVEGKNKFYRLIKRFFRERKKQFVREKLNFKQLSLLILGTLIRFTAYFVLFSPVYVVAYILKFNSENVTFLWIIIFGVFTNGVLITAVNRFFQLLNSENKRGYVETLRVKNMPMFRRDNTGGLIKSLLKIKIDLGDTIFSQIFESAHLQFVGSFKQISRFVITGLIIIGMALNIQSGLFYEMLQSFLFKEFDILFFILFLIFFSVKLIDVFIDLYSLKLESKYDN